MVINSTICRSEKINDVSNQKKCVILHRLSNGKKGKESAFATLFLNGESGQFAKCSRNKVK